MLVIIYFIFQLIEKKCSWELCRFGPRTACSNKHSDAGSVVILTKVKENVKIECNTMQLVYLFCWTSVSFQMLADVNSDNWYRRQIAVKAFA